MTAPRLLFVPVLAGLAACASPQAQTPPVPRAVRVVEARTGDRPRGLRFAVATEPAEHVAVAVKASGYVAAIQQLRGADGRLRALQPGDRVRAGTVLLRLRDADYVERQRHALGLLAEAEAQRAKAAHDLDRARTLFDADSLTRADLDAAVAADAMAGARVTAAQAQAETARLAVADCVVAAPLDGVVLERRVETGMLAGVGTVAFVIARVDDLKATIGVPDSVIPEVRLGQPLTVTTEAFPGEGFTGRVTGIAPAADPQSRVFAVELTLPNRDGRLRPGMIGAVELPGHADGVPRGLAVPLSAVVRAAGDPDAYGLFVVEGAEGRHVARARTVTLGPPSGNAVTVTGGLQAGERVIAMGATLVHDGETVRIIP